MTWLASGIEDLRDTGKAHSVRRETSTVHETLRHNGNIGGKRNRRSLPEAKVWWAHQDLNLEPTDYESPPALSGIHENSRFSRIPDNPHVWSVRFGYGRLGAIGHDI